MYFWVYADGLGQWRWSLRTANHRIIADGAEAYVNIADCYHGIQLVMQTDGLTPIRTQSVLGR